MLLATNFLATVLASLSNAMLMALCQPSLIQLAVRLTKAAMNPEKLGMESSEEFLLVTRSAEPIPVVSICASCQMFTHSLAGKLTRSTFFCGPQWWTSLEKVFLVFSFTMLKPKDGDKPTHRVLMCSSSSFTKTKPLISSLSRSLKVSKISASISTKRTWWLKEKSWSPSSYSSSRPTRAQELLTVELHGMNTTRK